MDDVFTTRRRPSKVATLIQETRLAQLRKESPETKLLRAIKLYEFGQQLKEVQKCNQPS